VNVGTVVRWVLVPVSAVAVVVSCAAAARAVVSFIDQRCLRESMVGGACVEPWHTSAVEASIYLGVIVAALAVVILPAMIAPTFKRTVAVILFLTAVSVAAAPYMLTTWTELLRPLAAAVLSGAAALWWVWSRRKSNEIT